MGIVLAGKLTICHEYSNDLCACSDKECKSAGLVWWVWSGGGG